MTSLERQSRLLLRAWPPPDRLERGDEILATTLDLVPPGRRRLPLALAASLVFGGLRARVRARPGIRDLHSYAMGYEGCQLPTRCHRWMLNDLLSGGWCRRMVTRWVAAGLTYTLIGMIIVQPLPPPFGMPGYRSTFAVLRS
ncbi:MAG: DUF5313 family protein [Actinobacteria bacterium]|nr:DUF5313 family protein [Actinomycetota bacterium]